MTTTIQPTELSADPVQARRSVFTYLTDMEESEGLHLINAQPPHPEVHPLSSTQMGDRVAALLGVRKSQAAQLIGVSESTLSRSTRPSRDMLDRAHALSSIFAEVHAVLGSAGAAAWLNTPNAALDGRAPLDLLPTRSGARQVEQVISALQDGTYL